MMVLKYIDAIPGVVCEGYHCIDGGHEVLPYDGGDRIFSEEIVRRLGSELIWKHCKCIVLL